MYIRGIGRTPFGHLRESFSELASKASKRALLDANMEIHDIDAIYVSNFCGGITQHQLHTNSLVADALTIHGIPIIRVETACASGGSALHQACIASHTYQNILVIGMEIITHDPLRSMEALSMASDYQKDQKNGLIFPAAYALIATEYMKRYGLLHSDLAQISLKNHSNANLNEFAHFHDKYVTMEQIEQSPMVSSPLQLFDCSPISDGACAVIVSAKKQSKRDIRILASALSAGNLSLSTASDITTFPAAKQSAKKAYTQAGCNPKDIDCACVHDCFTIAEIIAMEDLGFCAVGKAKNLIRTEQTTLGGTLPINTDGGLKADGHPIGASGLAQIYELVVQLRAEAGKRQVQKATLGLAHNIGGVGGTAAVHILGK